MGRQSFVKTEIEKKNRNLGNDEQKKKIRTEAVVFPKTKYEKKFRFRFWNGDKEGPKIKIQKKKYKKIQGLWLFVGSCQKWLLKNRTWRLFPQIPSHAKAETKIGKNRSLARSS